MITADKEKSIHSNENTLYHYKFLNIILNCFQYFILLFFCKLFNTVSRSIKKFSDVWQIFMSSKRQVARHLISIVVRYYINNSNFLTLVPDKKTNFMN